MQKTVENIRYDFGIIMNDFIKTYKVKDIFILLFSVASFVEKWVRLLAVVNLIAEETIILCVGGMSWK